MYIEMLPRKMSRQDGFIIVDSENDISVTVHIFHSGGKTMFHIPRSSSGFYFELKNRQKTDCVRSKGVDLENLLDCLPENYKMICLFNLAELRKL